MAHADCPPRQQASDRLIQVVPHSSTTQIQHELVAADLAGPTWHPQVPIGVQAVQVLQARVNRKYRRRTVHTDTKDVEVE